MSKKILVVDDSATDRSIIKNLLNEYNVITANNGKEALNLIDSNKDIELVILDLNMPVMNGFQVLETFNHNSKYSNIHTIIFTNHDEPDNEIKGLNLGAYDYIRKPLQIDSFKARIKVHIELIRIQKILKQKLYESDITINTIFDQAPIGITISHNREPNNGKDTDDIFINKEFERITGRTKEELIKTGWAQITHPDDLKEDNNNFNKYLAGDNKSYSMEKRYIRPDGSITWVYIVVAPLNLLWNDKYKHILFASDITSRKEAEQALIESERSMSVLLSNLPGLAYRCNYDKEWTMQYVSAGCFELTGYHPESLLYNKDISYNDLISPKYQEALRKEWEIILSTKKTFRYEYEIITAKGEHKWVLEMGQGIYNERSEIEALEGIVLDISDKKRLEDKLKYNSLHDFETDLYNRKAFIEYLEKEHQKNTSIKHALICINVSTIHLLSLTYGLHYSQILLKRITKNLKNFCSKNNYLFYIHEYRFVFYIKRYEDKGKLEEFCSDISKTLESLIFSERINVGIGILEINNTNIVDKDALIKNLLIASEKAVQPYKNSIGICFFNENMQKQIQREEDIKIELTQIIMGENINRLFLLFQPIFDLSSNKICGFEALARRNSVKYGLVPPLEFIPIAEKANLIVPLGNEIIIKALRFLKTLNENGYHSIAVSINISTIQLLNDDFINNLFIRIKEIQINPENVTLEITESIFDSNYQDINILLEKLRKKGIKISIDDFGTGYSSLARERELKVNCLKIDKYFIDKLIEVNPEQAITGDIISMGHKLGHCVIAEGVEHEKQLQYLKDKGCDKIQGYLIGKPLNQEAALKMIRKQDDKVYES